MMILGVVHLKSLPGSSSNKLNLDEITKLAQSDIDNLTKAGVSGVIIENFGDVPFVKNDVSKRTVASFTSVIQNLDIDSKFKIGINVLRNDGIAALSIAEATNADFVRINVLNNVMMFTDQGIIEGEANQIAEFNQSLNKKIEIFADVFVKHAVPPEGSKIENHAEELINRAGADVVIVTGDGTGHEIDIDDLNKVRNIVPSGKLAIGSGVDETNIDKYKDIADILIIGTSFKLDNNVENPVDFEKTKKIIEQIN